MRSDTFRLRDTSATIAVVLTRLAFAGCSDVLPSPSTPSLIADRLTLSA